MATIDELNLNTAKIRKAEAHRANLIEYRDKLMSELKHPDDDTKPASWTELRAATGLSLRGAQIGVERGDQQRARQA